VSASDADIERTEDGQVADELRRSSELEEEKRREEKENPPSLRSGGSAPKRAAGFDPSAIDLPDCVAASDWSRWCADRAKRRKPVTAEAAKLQLAKLEAFMAQGHQPKDVIDNSIANGYQGLFAPSAPGRTHHRPNGKHAGFSGMDYHQGVSDDGTLV
jgi:hypothetical protein